MQLPAHLGLDAANMSSLTEHTCPHLPTFPTNLLLPKPIPLSGSATHATANPDGSLIHLSHSAHSPLGNLAASTFKHIPIRGRHHSHRPPPAPSSRHLSPEQRPALPPAPAASSLLPTQQPARSCSITVCSKPSRGSLLDLDSSPRPHHSPQAFRDLHTHPVRPLVQPWSPLFTLEHPRWPPALSHLRALGYAVPSDVHAACSLNVTLSVSPP